MDIVRRLDPVEIKIGTHYVEEGLDSGCQAIQ